MSRKLEKSLQAAFNAPEPKRKSEFLSSLNYPKTTRLGFIASQARYIRKRVWVTALIVLIPVCVVVFTPLTANMLGFIWCISSLLPFIALAGLTEIARSSSYNMAELEMSCKHSLSDVILTRLGIIGATDMMVVAGVIILLRMSGNIAVLRAGVYLFVPFLLTCSLSLFTLNRLRSKDSIYVCGGISCGISILNALLSNYYRTALFFEYTILWTASLIVLLIWVAAEIIKLIRGMENYQWNLSSTA